MKSYGHKKEISFKTRSRLRTKLVSYYALLYELPSNPNIKKLCLKSIMLLPSDSDEKYLQKIDTLRF